jgi:hypothetical protein
MISRESAVCAGRWKRTVSTKKMVCAFEKFRVRRPFSIVPLAKARSLIASTAARPTPAGFLSAAFI